MVDVVALMLKWAEAIDENCLPDHWYEWQLSCVHADLIALNVQEVGGMTALQLLCEDEIALIQREYSYLSAESARLVRGYQPIVEGGGGWWVSGLDPLNRDEAGRWQSMSWGQLKPNRPRPKPDKPGKSIKYESPARVATRAIFLRTTEAIANCCYTTLKRQYGCALPPAHLARVGLWECVLRGNLPVVIVEGAKKAGCLLSMGYPAIALPGIWNGRRVVRSADAARLWDMLIPELDVFATPGRVIVFCFDQDEKPQTQKDVAAAIVATSRLFASQGCVCYTTQWEVDWGKGIDDVAAGMGDELVHEILMDLERL